MHTITDMDIYDLKRSQQIVVRELMLHPKGITTKDISNHGWVRFSSVLEKLRKKGYIIKTIKLEEENFLYKLIGKEVPNEAVRAYDRMYYTLIKNGFKEVAENLEELLEEAEIGLRNKQRRFN